MKLATFTWCVTVKVPDDFDEFNAEAFKKARHEAYLNVQENDGDILDDLRNEPE